MKIELIKIAYQIYLLPTISWTYDTVLYGYYSIEFIWLKWSIEISHRPKQKKMNKAKVIKVQQELIELLENQIIDLTTLSKMKNGDDDVTEIKRLKDLLKQR